MEQAETELQRGIVHLRHEWSNKATQSRDFLENVILACRRWMDGDDMARRYVGGPYMDGMKSLWRYARAFAYE